MRYLKEYNEFNNETFYHGSNMKLDTLKLMPRTSGESKFLGDGIYISNSKEISDSYGEYTYVVTLSEPLNSLPYFEEIDLNRLSEMCRAFQESDNDDLNYIGDDIEEAIEDNDLWWGKTLIATFERLDVNVTEALLLAGFNAIEAPINMLNQFRDRPDSDRNICIIKDDILSIELGN